MKACDLLFVKQTVVFLIESRARRVDIRPRVTVLWIQVVCRSAVHEFIWGTS